MLRWLSRTVRVFAIATIALITVIAYGVMRLGTLFIRDRARRASRVARLRGRLLAWAMATLGATFIKLGQVMSSRPDLFPPETIAELRRLQDRLPAFPFRKAARIIEAELGAIDQHFRSIDPVPVAAASVAQVHRAELLDGTQVAVKVLRPGVRQTTERDGAILLMLARVMALSPTIRLSEPVDHMRHFVEGIIGQTDLRNEVRNYETFRRNFADHKDVVFPRVHPELSSERVLTMDFIEGKKVDGLGPGRHPELARLTRTVFFQMVFQDGFVHADLHPGNMLLMADGRLAVFDVGLVKQLGDDILMQLLDVSKCIAMGAAADFVAHLRRFHKYMEGGVDWAAVERDAEVFVRRFRDRNAGDLEMSVVINDLFATGRRHKIHPMPDLTLVLVGVVTAEGIAKTLDPQVDTFREMATFLMPILQRRGLGLVAS